MVGFADPKGLRKVFDLNEPWQMIAKLRYEIGQVKQFDGTDNPNLIFAAFNAAATAWHIIDWVKTYPKTHTGEYPQIQPKHYRDHVTKACPHLRLCRQISVGWKHRLVTEHNDPGIQAVGVINIYVKTVDGKPTDVTKYRQTYRVYDGERSIELVELFEEVLKFWTGELSRLGFNSEFERRFSAIEIPESQRI